MRRITAQISHPVFHDVIMIFLFFFLVSVKNLAAQEVEIPEWSKTAGSLTVFQPGDAVRIEIWELYPDERLNINITRDYPINPEGYIVMPLVGPVKVRGLTVYELMQDLEEKYRVYLRAPYIHVRPLIRITLQGAFNQPGSYRADPSSSLWDLVAMAGGPNSRADLKRMYVERGGKIIIKRLLESFESGYALEEVGIETGDQIIVPIRRGINLQTMVVIINLFASLALLYLRLRYGTW